MRSFPSLFSLLAIASILALQPLEKAQAQLTFDLTPADKTASPGDSAAFFGTLRNVGSSEIFLNGIGFNFGGSAGSYLTGDDTPFFSDVPFSLTGGGSYSGTIFRIQVAGNAPSSTSFLGSVDILGGSGSTPAALDTLASQNFRLSIPSATAAAAPEPGSLALLAGALLPLMGVAARRRRV